MKRHDLIRYLEAHGCQFVREGANHTIHLNPANGKITAVPRHREVLNFTARKICRDLEILAP